MTGHFELVAYGENLTTETKSGEVEQILRRLEESLHNRGLAWSNVSMLLLFNSRWFESAGQMTQGRAENDLIASLNSFCTERNWLPSLIGCSSLSSFFSSVGQEHNDISNGYLFVAVCSRLVDRIPVRSSLPMSKGGRAHASAEAVRRAAWALRAKLNEKTNGAIDEDWVYGHCTALLFSTGSGHIAQAGEITTAARREEVQFRECFAAGEHLAKLNDQKKVVVVGGHASNNRPQASQLQILYSSKELPDGTIEYRWDHTFGAVAAFLPNISLRVDLSHPYKPEPGSTELVVDFCHADEYSSGRYFYLRRIGHAPVEDFFGKHWGLSKERVWEMARTQAPIPSAPELHTITIASTKSGLEMDKAWPNVPVWFEVRRGDDGEDEIVLRLVRAEYEDVKLYLMRLNPNHLEGYMERFMSKTMAASSNASISFLCESRKYVLMDLHENSEAEAAIRMANEDHTTVGVYLNGENSVGASGSIGYHNYSQVSSMVPKSDIGLLPKVLADLVSDQQAIQ